MAAHFHYTYYKLQYVIYNSNWVSCWLVQEQVKCHFYILNIRSVLNVSSLLEKLHPVKLQFRDGLKVLASVRIHVFCISGRRICFYLHHCKHETITSFDICHVLKKHSAHPSSHRHHLIVSQIFISCHQCIYSGAISRFKMAVICMCNM